MSKYDLGGTELIEMWGNNDPYKLFKTVAGILAIRLYPYGMKGSYEVYSNGYQADGTTKDMLRFVRSRGSRGGFGF